MQKIIFSKQLRQKVDAVQAIFMSKSIPFNSFSSREADMAYMKEVMNSGHLTGKGKFADKCDGFFSDKYGFSDVLLTTSCTAALEMAALLIDIKEGDEVIIPSFTFVSTANAFALRGAKIVFADSGTENPDMDVAQLEKLITPRTRAIVPVHYAGIACDMDRIMELAAKHNLVVIEDAAHAIDGFYKGKPLGSFGSLAAFSFHETKNITCGEGGMLVINDKKFADRAEVLIEKGTNRKDFNVGRASKYEWVDLGSSYRLPELSAAFLFAQLEALDQIQEKRKKYWNAYYSGLTELEKDGVIKLPVIPEYAQHNSSIFYILCKNEQQRAHLIQGLSLKGISAVFHYQPLHSSPFYIATQNKSVVLTHAEKYGSCLLRLPLHVNLTAGDVNYVIDCIREILKTEI